MTKKKLFKNFYQLERMNQGEYCPFGPFVDEIIVNIIANAVRAGIDDMTILGIKHSATIALEDREKTHAEPSNNSVAIQMLMHTFGRVRRFA